MNFSYILFLLAILALMYMSFEARNVKLERIEFTKNSEFLKVVHISDIHINRLLVPQSKIVDLIFNEKPDIIIITGDLIEKAKDIPAIYKFLDKLTGISPIYVCFGNHDYKAFTNDAIGFRKFHESLSNKKNITVLNNQALSIEKNSKKYNLIGISDLKYGSPDINSALKMCSKETFCNIGLTHNPDIILDMPEGCVDYLFCGHFHGGQIWLPFRLEFRLLRSDKLCKMNIIRGLHNFKDINLYINRGLGNVTLPLRFFSRPEITVYHLP